MTESRSFVDRAAGQHIVTFATSRLEVRPLVVPGPLRRAVLVIGDLLAALGIVLCIPLGILAVGIPIALCARLLLWIGGLL